MAEKRIITIIANAIKSGICSELEAHAICSAILNTDPKDPEYIRKYGTASAKVLETITH